MKNLIKACVFNVEQYEPGKPIEVLRRELGLEGEICKLASNENPFGASPLALDAIRNALEESNFYPDNSCYLLREKLGEHLGFSPGNILVGNGTTELIYLTGIAFLNPEDKLIMSESAFIMPKITAQIVNCALVEVPLKKYCHDLERILEAVDDVLLLWGHPLASFRDSPMFLRARFTTPNSLMVSSRFWISASR